MSALLPKMQCLLLPNTPLRITVATSLRLTIFTQNSNEVHNPWFFYYTRGDITTRTAEYESNTKGAKTNEKQSL